MENQNKTDGINYRSMIYTDAWKTIFDAITRLTTIEEDLDGENVKALEELAKSAESVKEKTSKT